MTRRFWMLAAGLMLLTATMALAQEATETPTPTPMPSETSTETATVTAAVTPSETLTPTESATVSPSSEATITPAEITPEVGLTDQALEQFSASDLIVPASILNDYDWNYTFVLSSSRGLQGWEIILGQLGSVRAQRGANGNWSAEIRYIFAIPSETVISRIRVNSYNVSRLFGGNYINVNGQNWGCGEWYQQFPNGCERANPALPYVGDIDITGSWTGNLYVYIVSASNTYQSTTNISSVTFLGMGENPFCAEIDSFCSTPTPTPTNTPTPTATPTFTPTRVPRILEPQAQAFHDRAAQFGLPAPFTLWPVTEPNDLFQNGYGPNWFSRRPQEGCYPAAPTIPPPAPDATPGPTQTPRPDPCQYQNVNRIHPGVDYFSQSDPDSRIAIPSNVVALCDGIIIPGRTARTEIGGGGSAAARAGFGLSLRCLADDPYDPDYDGDRNVSNIVVVYNHLTNVIGFNPASPEVPYPYQIVREGDIIGTTTGYQVSSNIYVPPHLDLQIYLAYDYETPNEVGAIQLNPRLMFAFPMARNEDEQAPYPPEFPNGVWTLQGRKEGFGSISYWQYSQNDAFIDDIVVELETTLFPPTSPYVYPNCVGFPASSNHYGTNVTPTPSVTPVTHCTLDRNDVDVTP